MYLKINFPSVGFHSSTLLLAAVLLAPFGLRGQSVSSTAAAEAQPPGAAGQTVKDGLFDNTGKFAKGAIKVSEIDMDPATMDAIGGGSGYAKRYHFSLVHEYQYDKPGMYKQEDLEEYYRKLSEGGWRCSVRTRDKDRSTDICNRLSPDRETRESAIMEVGPLKLTFIHSSELVSAKDKNAPPESTLQKHP